MEKADHQHAPQPIKPTDTFALIAANTANFYSTLIRKYKDKFKDEASLLAAAGIIDAANYVLAEKSIPPQKIINAAKEAIIQKHSLLSFIIELEKMIFEIDQPIMDKMIFGERTFDKESINHAVISQKDRIEKTINNWLSVSEFHKVEEPVVTSFMGSPEMIEFLDELGLLK